MTSWESSQTQDRGGIHTHRATRRNPRSHDSDRAEQRDVHNAGGSVGLVSYSSARTIRVIRSAPTSPSAMSIDLQARILPPVDIRPAVCGAGNYGRYLWTNVRGGWNTPDVPSCTISRPALQALPPFTVATADNVALLG
jgi:hypothetical protein